MQFIVYSKPNCPPCKATKRYLDERGVDYEERDAREHAEYLKTLGVRATPVVTVVTDAGEQHWSGFCPTLIDEVLEGPAVFELLARTKDRDVVIDGRGVAWQASMFDNERRWYSAMGRDITLFDDGLVERAPLRLTKRGRKKTLRKRDAIVDWLDTFRPGHVVIDSNGDAWQLGLGQHSPYWYRCYGGATPTAPHEIANLAPFTPVYPVKDEEASK